MADDGKVKGFTNNAGFGGSDLPDLKEMPFRMMAVGNFCGANRSEARNPVAIDAHDFDKVLEQLWPRAVFEVENHLGSGKVVEIDFTPKSIKDFEPRNVAARIPALAPVADFIERARGLAAGTLKPAEFKRDLAAIQAVPALREPLEMVFDKAGGPAASSGQARGDDAAPSTNPKDSGDAPIDSIFNMVDGGPKKQTADKAIDAFVGGMGSGQKGIDVSAAIAAAEKVLEKQLVPVLMHPQLHELERNWRGLHLLCKRGKGAAIEVYDGTFDDWQAAVFNRELAGASEAPLAMVLVADSFTNSAAHLDLIQQWGDSGGQLQCAVVFEASEEFLGIDMVKLAGLSASATVFDDARFDKWRSLRDKDESRWLVAGMNPYLSRPAHTRGKQGIDAPPLWGSPVWIIGSAVAQSVQRTGWPTQHTGVGDGEVEGLPTLARDGAEFPLGAVLSDRHLKDLNKSGFTPLMAQPNHDSAWVLLAPTVHRPSKAEEEGKMGSLAYQLLAARIGEAVIRAKGRLSVPNDADATVSKVESFLNALLSNTGAGATAMARAQDGVLEIAIRTGRDVLNGVEMQFGVGL
jgi:type VI secretion system ImpB/VipA family protein